MLGGGTGAVQILKMPTSLYDCKKHEVLEAKNFDTGTVVRIEDSNSFGSVRESYRVDETDRGRKYWQLIEISRVSQKESSTDWRTN